MKYEKVPNFDNDLLRQLDSIDPEKVLMALLSVVLYGEDYNFAVNTTRRFISHSDEYVRGAAMECVAHIARLWNTLPADLIDSLNRSVNDKSEWVQGKGDFAMDDLEIFIKNYKRPTN